MPKGRSYSNDNWKSFQKGVHTFVEDGFVHDKTLSFKAKLESEKDGVAIHESIVEKAEGLSGVGEVKFWFAADQNRSIFAKIGSATNLNLHFDNGVRPLKAIHQNCYGGLEVNRSLTEKIGKIGLQLFKENNWSYNSRLQYNFTRKIFTLDQKGSLNWRNWRINGFTNIQFASRLGFNNTSLLITWVPSKDQYFLKLGRKNGETKTLRTFFEQVAFGWSSDVSYNQKIGIEVKINLINTTWKTIPKAVESVWLASQWNLGETTVKAKVNKDLSHAVSITNKLSTYGQYSIGVEATEVGSKNRFRFGTQIELNL